MLQWDSQSFSNCKKWCAGVGNAHHLSCGRQGAGRDDCRKSDRRKLCTRHHGSAAGIQRILECVRLSTQCASDANVAVLHADFE